jgi:acyl carrier protein
MLWEWNAMGLDTVELVLKIEEDFDIEIPRSEAQDILTVGDLARCISNLCTGKNNRVPVDFAFERIANILEEDFGGTRRLVTPSARIVKDLGLD